MKNKKIDPELFYIEKEANRFAMELLMPEYLIKKEFKKYSHIIDFQKIISKMAEIFEVEEYIMTIRLFNLGYFAIKKDK